MIDKTPIVRAHREALARGARHEAQALRARYALRTRDLDGAAFGSDKPLVIVPRRHVPDPPVAFLASFNAPERDVVIPLKRGVTRVGVGPPFGDFDLPRPRPIEQRQWLVMERGGVFFVADDHSTNESAVLPRTVPKLQGTVDPRWDDGDPDYTALREQAGAIVLDWPGTAVHSLAEGDVLVTIYAALVFGTMAETH